MKKKTAILCLLAFLPCYLSARVITYGYASEVPLSNQCKVWVDNSTQPVIQTPVPATYVTFGMEGTVEVRIQPGFDVKWAEIRPKSLGITPEVKDGVVTFTLTKPAKLSVEFNGKLKAPLFIFANPPEEKPDRNDKNVLYFEAGKIHTPGVIRPKSGQHIFIEAGAWVKGAISAQDVEGVKISGYGVMDGTGNNRITDTTRNDGKPFYQRFLEFYDSKNLHIEGLVLHNSFTWQVVPINCDNVMIRDLKLVADNASDDGIDVVRSRNVRIDNCFIRVKDDCIAIKAHMDYPDDCIVDDVQVENCTFWNAAWGNGIEIGFELYASEVKNIVFRNIDIIHVESGAVFSIHNSDKATVKNVLYEDIRIEQAGYKLMDFSIIRSKYGRDSSSDEAYLNLYLDHTIWDNSLLTPPEDKAKYTTYRGHIENIRLKNIQIIEGHYPYSLFAGYDSDHLVKDIVIENLQVNGRKISSPREMKMHTEFAKSIRVY